MTSGCLFLVFQDVNQPKRLYPDVALEKGCMQRSAGLTRTSSAPENSAPPQEPKDRYLVFPIIMCTSISFNRLNPAPGCGLGALRESRNKLRVVLLEVESGNKGSEKAIEQLAVTM